MTDRLQSEVSVFLDSVLPVIEALGGSMVGADDAGPTDIELVWKDEIVGYVRGPELHGALDRLMQSVERELGVELADMTREQKQIAVRRLDEQGAFLLRGAVEDIAQLLEVSRVTLYSYLNAIRP
jgi:hypothetical protein